MTKRLLLISPYFPPLKAIGSKRAVNIVQGLTALDWKVDILCTREFFQNEITTYQFEVPNGVTVDCGFVTRWLRPIIKLLKSRPKTQKIGSQNAPSQKTKNTGMSLTPFDQYMWDVPGAVRTGKKMIRRKRPDVILVNADPWSGLLVGHLLSKWSGIPWVADFRDPWTAFDQKMALRPNLIRKMIYHYERKFFNSASKVIFNTENCLEEYNRKYEKSTRDRFTFVRNAYNMNLYDQDKIPNLSKTFVFGYFGSFRDFVSSEFLLKGFTIFIRRYKLSTQQVTLKVFGSINDDFSYYMHKFGLHHYVQLEGTVRVEESLNVLRSWDTLILVVDPHYRLMIPAKLYDYLAARKPVLALSENEEVNRIIAITKSGKTVGPTDVEGVAEQLWISYNNRIQGLLPNRDWIEPFGLQAQMEKFNELLTGITN